MIDKNLDRLAESNIYPFHMPGHKRRKMELSNPYSIDITEIDDFDNLHDAQGIIKEAQEEAARLYGAKRSFFLVNGSTCGLLAAISAAVPKGKKVIVARNSHKAVYHGLFLRELKPVYVYPTITREGLQGEITVEAIEEKLKTNSDAAAVVITSPTYDGIVSDVEAIARLVHSYNLPLIVDSAHGAHFGFEDRLPENATRLGADLVILSLHKTLPAFTQTALLNVCSDRVDEGKIAKFLGIYETSSPSYVFMAGMDVCIRYIRDNKDKLFPHYMDMLEKFYNKVDNLTNLRVLGGNKCKDITKIIILTEGSSIDGPKLYETLLNRYELQLEMCAGNYALALSSVMDTEEGLDRLAAALIEIDEQLSDKAENNNKEVAQIASGELYRETEGAIERAMEIHEVEELSEDSFTYVKLEDAVDKINGEYVFLYPPGIPIIVPGELISKDLVERLIRVKGQGLKLHGLSDEGWIKIVNPS